MRAPERRSRALLPTLSFLLCLAACGGADIDEEHWMQRGAEVLGPFKASLQAELGAGLARGAAEAITACRLEAPRLSELASQDVRVGRTSSRLRNPANAPEPWLRPLLGAYAADPDDTRPRVVRLDAERIGYVEPIRVQRLCLTCHGEVVDAAVERRLRQLYPDDQARGYRDGDFRGLFWVELPAPELD